MDALRTNNNLTYKLCLYNNLTLRIYCKIIVNTLCQQHIYYSTHGLYEHENKSYHTNANSVVNNLAIYNSVGPVS